MIKKDMMPDVDSTIYLDTDILVVSDLHNIWKEFDRFTSKQMLGMAQEREEWNIDSYYNNATRIKFPFIPPHGINSGVLLMNLTRMRDFSFFEKIHLISNHYHSMLRLYDQDLLNILGYFNPG
jgi:lipopolysaccharide biosynthesis glycosyltransferase